jgi:hypothetical protein
MITKKASNNSEKVAKDEEKPEMSFAMLEGTCCCYGKAKHKSPTCQSKDTIPKEEWAINKAKAKEQSHVNADNQESTSSNDQEW